MFKGTLIQLLTILMMMQAKLCAQSTGEWTSLFNGKDLKNWTPKISGQKAGINWKNTFMVTEGALKVNYDEYENFSSEYGHLFYDTPYSHYRLRFEYRFIGDQVPGGADWAFRNNGIMYHAQSPQSMGLNQDFPISLEAQLLGSQKDIVRTTMNLCTPGTQVSDGKNLLTAHCLNSTSQYYWGDDWVKAELIVLGDSMVYHIVENDTVFQFSRPEVGGGVVNEYLPEEKIDGTKLSRGYIAIQSESHPTEFRKIELLNLSGCMDKSASNYKSYFIKKDNSECLYED